MNFVIHWIFTDTKTKEKWKTPNHNDDDQLDDFHRTIKPKIMRAIEGRLKNRFGKNCDIEIRDGNIFIISQIFDDETGKKSRKSIPTKLKADLFLERLIKFIFSAIGKEIPIKYVDLVSMRIERVESGKIVITVEVN